MDKPWERDPHRMVLEAGRLVVVKSVEIHCPECGLEVLALPGRWESCACGSQHYVN